MTASPTIAGELRALTRLFAAAGLDTPELDARLLMEEATGLPREKWVAQPSLPLAPTAAETLSRFAQRRLAREPVSRILGHRAFYGRTFEVSPDTLDPRPDSETLIEAALALVGEEGWSCCPLRILDIGTGTGCLLLTLLAELPNATGIGLDVSPGALAVACRNAERLGVADRAGWLHGDALRALGALPEAPFDLVVANPPYIPSAEIAALDPEVARYDPRVALDGGADGLDFYRAIIAAAQRIVPAGWLVLELGAGQAEGVAALLAACPVALPDQPVRRFLDLGSHTRCVALRTHSP